MEPVSHASRQAGRQAEADTNGKDCRLSAACVASGHLEDLLPADRCCIEQERAHCQLTAAALVRKGLTTHTSKGLTV